jgi:hypothetical protein
MKRLWQLTLTLLVALSSAPAFAGDFCCNSAPACCTPAPTCCTPAPTCCAPTCCTTCCAPTCCCEETPPDRWYFRVERTEQRCLVDVPVKKWYATPSKVVCEKADGCCKEKVTCTEIVPVCKEGSKKEEKVKVCTTVYLHCGPCVDVKTVVAPPPAAMPPAEAK